MADVVNIMSDFVSVIVFLVFLCYPHLTVVAESVVVFQVTFGRAHSSGCSGVARGSAEAEIASVWDAEWLIAFSYSLKWLHRQWFDCLLHEVFPPWNYHCRDVIECLLHEVFPPWNYHCRNIPTAQFIAWKDEVMLTQAEDGLPLVIRRGRSLEFVRISPHWTLEDFCLHFDGYIITHCSKLVRPTRLSVSDAFKSGDEICLLRRLRGGMLGESPARGFHDNSREAAEARIPQWDGSPASYLKFERLVEWWLEGEDLDYYRRTGVSLAARFVRRQQGFARARAEEFTPTELRATPAELYTVETVVTDFGYALDEDQMKQN